MSRIYWVRLRRWRASPGRSPESRFRPSGFHAGELELGSGHLIGFQAGSLVKAMHQVIYSSAAVKPFDDTELTQLLAVARTNNGRLGVTGMLLYHEGSFLQALEGHEEVLAKLYATIGRDQRHHRLVALLRRPVETRHFDQWHMGFVSTKVLPKSTPGFSEYLRLRGDPIEGANAAARLLGAFRDGRFRSYVNT